MKTATCTACATPITIGRWKTLATGHAPAISRTAHGKVTWDCPACGAADSWSRPRR